MDSHLQWIGLNHTDLVISVIAEMYNHCYIMESARKWILLSGKPYANSPTSRE